MLPEQIELQKNFKEHTKTVKSQQALDIRETLQAAKVKPDVPRVTVQNQVVEQKERLRLIMSA